MNVKIAADVLLFVGMCSFAVYEYQCAPITVFIKGCRIKGLLSEVANILNRKIFIVITAVETNIFQYYSPTYNLNNKALLLNSLFAIKLLIKSTRKLIMYMFVVIYIPYIVKYKIL